MMVATPAEIRASVWQSVSCLCPTLPWNR